MRNITRIAIAAAGSVCLIGPAAAAELTGAEIKELISGKTVYLECSAASTGGAGRGIICSAADGSALYKSAGRGMLHGTWAVKENTACTDWKEVPNNPCSRYDKQGDTVSLINVATGLSRLQDHQNRPWKC